MILGTVILRNAPMMTFTLKKCTIRTRLKQQTVSTEETYVKHMRTVKSESTVWTMTKTSDAILRNALSTLTWWKSLKYLITTTRRLIRNIPQYQSLTLDMRWNSFSVRVPRNANPMKIVTALTGQGAHAKRDHWLKLPLWLHLLITQRRMIGLQIRRKSRMMENSWLQSEQKIFKNPIQKTKMKIIIITAKL